PSWRFRMSLPPRDHRITLAAAVELTRRYREGAGPTAEKAGAFHADQVKALLGPEGCVALRIYYGKHPDGRNALILVGMDENDNEMTELLDDFGFPCPPFCTDGSPLNG